MEQMHLMVYLKVKTSNSCRTENLKISYIRFTDIINDCMINKEFMGITRKSQLSYCTNFQSYKFGINVMF
jgi:hypothetical protein